MLNATLRKVAKTLNKLQVPFALIGALAVAARGAFRTTEDVDLLIVWPLNNGEALAKSLTENGLPSTFQKGLGDDPLAGVIRTDVTTEASTTKCDILFPLNLWQQQAVTRATQLDMEGFVVPVLQADDLFLLKLYAGGPQDLLDAAKLYELQSEDEHNAWKERARQIGRSKAFARCMTFVGDHG